MMFGGRSTAAQTGPPQQNNTATATGNLKNSGDTCMGMDSVTITDAP